MRDDSDPETRRRTPDGFRLGVLFGLMYFVQGIGEPTEGLVAQPVRSILRSWGHDVAGVASFAAALSVPWSLKPLYGLLSDFVPFLGLRRKSYLLVCNLVSALGFIAAYHWAAQRPDSTALFLFLILPSVGVAFSDVLIDALMVEQGQPAGITGKLQSVQWAALYGALVITGSAGGWLSEQRREELGFLACGLACLAAFFVTVFFVRERPARAPAESFRATLSALRGALRSRRLLAACGFLALWNLELLSPAVLQHTVASELGLGDRFYGDSVSLNSLACVAAAAAYGFYCRRVSLHALLRLSVILGAAATAAYWLLAGALSARVIALSAGVLSMTANLVQLDLAARILPPLAAGTLFALVMALENTAVTLATWWGGEIYEAARASSGPDRAFALLVLLATAVKASSWIFLRHLRVPPALPEGGGFP